MGNCVRRSSASQSSPQDDAIDAFIDRLMQDTNVNCTYIPDFIERDIYRNFIRLILGNLVEFVQSVKITVLNHVITLHIEPIRDLPPHDDEITPTEN